MITNEELRPLLIENAHIKMSDIDKKILKDVRILDAKPELVENPYSHEKVLLQPEAIALYDLMIGCELSLQEDYDEDLVDLFVAAKDVFLANWPDEFMKLID